MMVPTDSSELAEIEPDLGDLFAGGGGFGLLFQLFHQGNHSLVDAALQVHGVQASGHVLDAFAHDGLGQHGGGGGAVTGDVVGLGSDFLNQLRTHVLQLVFQLNFFGDRHTVFGHGGAPNERSSTTLRPLGPRVTFTALARMFTPSTIRVRASVPKTTSFAANVWLLNISEIPCWRFIHKR